jgi:predicted TIM-barrel fold metal-dependent hydrolase
MPSDLPIIDIHTHLWRSREIGRQALGGRMPDPQWTGTLEEHLETMHRAGVDRAVVLLVTPTRSMRERALQERGRFGDGQWAENSGLALDRKLLDRLDRTNTWGCAIVQDHPELVPFINVDLDLLAGEQLRNYVGNRVAEGARGVKLLPIEHYFHGNDRRLWPMYEYLESVRLPVLSQSGAGGGVSPYTSDSWGRPLYFGEVAAAFPKLNLILAHFGHGYMADVLRLTSSHENIHFDTTILASQIGSSPELSPEKTVALFRSVGIRHIVFGTNFPFAQDRTHDYDALRSLGLSEEEQRLIFYGNAARILNDTPVSQMASLHR